MERVDTGEDMRFERRSWKVERVGWGAMALVVAAAGLGAFGSGPLSRAEAVAPGGALRVEYERFARHRAPSEMEVVVAPREWPGGQVRLWASRELVEGLELEEMAPEPLTVEHEAEGSTLVFAAPAPGRAFSLRVQAKPERVGRVAGRIRVAGGPAAELRQLVYP